MITYSATLDVPAETATLLTDLLIAERRRRGTGFGARAASARDQALLVLRWFRDDTGMPTLARDAGVSTATGYRYLHEGIDVLAAAAPGLRGALLAARAAGHPHVTVDGTLIRTDRGRAPGPTARTDRLGRQVGLWWSGKHAAHGGNGQVIAAPDGWPLWTSGVRPGREHDTTALRAHPEALPLLAEWTDDSHAVLAHRADWLRRRSGNLCPLRAHADHLGSSELRCGIRDPLVIGLVNAATDQVSHRVPSRARA